MDPTTEQQIRELIRDELRRFTEAGRLGLNYPPLAVAPDNAASARAARASEYAAGQIGAAEASRLIHEHAQRDQALHRDDKVRFHVMPETPPESGFLASSNIGGLYMLDSVKDLPPSTLTGDVWKLDEIHDTKAPAMVTLENTTTKARITVKQDDWWRAYHYLGHMGCENHVAINTEYMHRSGHRYAIKDRSEETARVFLVPTGPGNAIDASTWVRIDKLVPPMWQKLS